MVQNLELLPWEVNLIEIILLSRVFLYFFFCLFKFCVRSLLCINKICQESAELSSGQNRNYKGRPDTLFEKYLNFAASQIINKLIET